MAKIIFIHPEEQNFIRTADLLVGERNAAIRATLSEAEQQSTAVWFRHPGSDSELQLFEVRLEPNSVAAPTPMRATKSWWSLMVRCGSERRGVGQERVFLFPAIRFTGSRPAPMERVS